MTRRPRPAAVTPLGTGARMPVDGQNRALVAPGSPRRPHIGSDTTIRFSEAVCAFMHERVLQAHIRGFLEDLAFTVVVIPDMRKTRAGWPDLAFWHPGLPGRLYLWELKREGRYPTPAQRAALAHLATVPGIDARIVRPSDWEVLRDGLLAEIETAQGLGGVNDG